MRNVQLPKWVVACLVVAFSASLSLAAAQMASYTLIKPFTLNITVAPCPLTVTAVNFAYDPALNQHTTCNVQISSSATTQVTATVYVYLRNATQAVVAQGQLTQTFNPGVTAISVPLTWTAGRTTDDVASGYLMVQPV